MKKLICCLLLVFSAINLTGCWDRYEIEDRAIILGIGIDKYEDLYNGTDNGDNPNRIQKEFPIDRELINLTVQIAVPGRIPLGPSDGGGGGEETVWVVEVSGYTLDDAIQNLQQQLAQKMYLGHLQIIAVSETVARHGLEELSDFLRRNHEVRRTAWMLVSQGTAKAAVRAAPPLEEVPSLYLSETMNNAVSFGKFPKSYLGYFWIDSSRKGKEGFLPYISVMSDGNIMINGLAYFVEDKMVGNTTPLQIGAFMNVMGDNPGGYTIATKLPDKEGAVMYRSKKRDSDIQIELRDGLPHVNIKITSEGYIEEQTKLKEGIRQDSNYLRKIEAEIKKTATVGIESLIKQVQEDGSDIFGIGERIRGQHSNFWNEQVKTKEKWQELFPEIKIKVDVNIRIKRVGMRTA